MREGQGRRGFTLIELLVTMVLALVIVGAVYMLYAQSVTGYRIESQILDMQARLRFGLEHIKRDFRRAGFMATPNSAVDSDVCPAPTNHLRSVTLLPNNGSVYQPWPSANPYIQPSAITLFGDFFSGRVYKTAGIQDNKVFLALTDSFPASEVEFNRIFLPFKGVSVRYLRLVTQDQFEMYLPIDEADWEERSITVNQSVPALGGGSLCGIAGFGEGLDVSVAGFVRYRLLNDGRANAPAGKTDLVREELQLNGTDAVAGSQLVIADYAVDLQFYDFGVDTDTLGTSPTLQVFSLYNQVADSGGGGMLGTTLNAAPENLRFLTVKLTVRTDQEDPNHSFGTRQTLFDSLDGFELDTMEGACRTATLASRVELTSLAVRNLKAGGGGP